MDEIDGLQLTIMNYYYRLYLIVVCSFFLVNCHYGQAYTFMTYNIRYNNPHDGLDSWEHRKQDMVAFMDSIDVDIFGIQEGLFTQVEYLNNELKDYQYLGVGRDDGKTKGEYCALFYQPLKFTVIESGTFWLSETPDQISTGWDAALPRICTYGLFSDQSQNQFWVFNTHFDHKGAQARAQAAKLIVDRIRLMNKKDLPVILMGDLNATSKEPPIENIVDHLRDHLGHSGITAKMPYGTFNGFKQIQADKRIDYVFSKGFKVVAYVHLDPRRAQGRFLSDHLPVKMEVVINEKN